MLSSAERFAGRNNNPVSNKCSRSRLNTPDRHCVLSDSNQQCDSPEHGTRTEEPASASLVSGAEPLMAILVRVTTGLMAPNYIM